MGRVFFAKTSTTLPRDWEAIKKRSHRQLREKSRLQFPSRFQRGETTSSIYTQYNSTQNYMYTINKVQSIPRIHTLSLISITVTLLLEYTLNLEMFSCQLELCTL